MALTLFWSSWIDSSKKLNLFHAIKLLLLWIQQNFIFIMYGKTIASQGASCQIAGLSLLHNLWKICVLNWELNLSFPQLTTNRKTGRLSIWIKISSSISVFLLLNDSTSGQTGFCSHNSPIMQSSKPTKKSPFKVTCSYAPRMGIESHVLKAPAANGLADGITKTLEETKNNFERA